MSNPRSYRILVINPGSTSTKLGVFEDESCVYEKNLRHSIIELEKFEKVWDQYEFRKREILKLLQSMNYDLSKFDAVVGRGGLLKPIESGTYRVNERMIADLRMGVQGHHASNLGGVLAYGIGWDYLIPAFIVDPPSVDEFEPFSRFSGIVEITRTSLFHALNIRATARKAAKKMNKPMEELNLIVAHLGGGITVAALKKGKIVDVNNGISEGPFSPERSGSLPVIPLIELCFSGKFTKAQIMKKIVGGGGLVSYFHTNNADEIEAMIRAGNSHARFVYEAMAYQVSKEIASRSVSLFGKVDEIVLTGGLAHSVMLTDWIRERCGFLGEIALFPGENELSALALGGLRVLRGEETPKIYDAQRKTIGVFYSENLEEYDVALKILESKLNESGYKFRQKDENLEILVRNCRQSMGTMHNIIEEFIDGKVNLIISIGSPAAFAVKLYLKGKEIPVVCMACFDPVVMGLASNYISSGNNVCGSCYRVDIFDQFRSGLIELIPDLKRVGVIYKSGELQSENQLDETRMVCRNLGFELFPFDAPDSTYFDKALDSFLSKKVQAVFLVSDTVSASADPEALNNLCSTLPTLCALESTVKKGGLVGRVVDWETFCVETVKIALRVLNGNSPASIPILKNMPSGTIFNMKTALALGLKPSKSYLEKMGKIIPEFPPNLKDCEPILCD